MTFTRLNPQEYYTVDISSVIAAASGITIEEARFASWGKMATLYLVFKRNAAINVAANGDITNFDVGTLVSGKRPMTYAGIWNDADGGAFAGGFIYSNGRVIISGCDRAGSAYTIAANTKIWLYSTYVLA